VISIDNARRAENTGGAALLIPRLDVNGPGAA